MVANTSILETMTSLVVLLFSFFACSYAITCIPNGIEVPPYNNFSCNSSAPYCYTIVPINYYIKLKDKTMCDVSYPWACILNDKQDQRECFTKAMEYVAIRLYYGYQCQVQNIKYG